MTDRVINRINRIQEILINLRESYKLAKEAGNTEGMQLLEEEARPLKLELSIHEKVLEKRQKRESEVI